MTDQFLSAPEQPSIFIAWARSFWWAVFAVVQFFTEFGDPAVEAVATSLAVIFGGDPVNWSANAVSIMPLLTSLLVVLERRGASRPYTLNPRAKGAWR